MYYAIEAAENVIVALYQSTWNVLDIGHRTLSHQYIDAYLKCIIHPMKVTIITM